MTTRTAPPPQNVAVLGRHSRNDPLKWPDTEDEIRAAYPDLPNFKISILGGVPGTVEPCVAPNWRILPFANEGIADFLRRLDFYVFFHSRQWVEAFGISMAEAMACGAVPLRTPSAGAADQIKHGVNGYIFPFWDFETLGKQLIELCKNEPLREKLAKGALHTARTKFSGTAMAKATMKVYRRAIEPHSKA